MTVFYQRLRSPSRWWAVACIGLLQACASGNGATDPEGDELVTEFRLDAPPGLAQSVVVDSARWEPLSFGFNASDELELEGSYTIYFRNTAESDLELRYDLRFLDRDGFFFDLFIPFGLPVLLARGQASRETGMFQIRSGADDPGLVSTMQIVATVAAAGND